MNLENFEFDIIPATNDEDYNAPQEMKWFRRFLVLKEELPTRLLNL